MIAAMLIPGDPVPTFYTQSLGNPRYAFDTVAGRHVAVSFAGSAATPGVAAFHAALTADQHLLDDQTACAFVVSCDPADATGGLLTDRYPGLRILIDQDLAMRRLFMGIPAEAPPPPTGPLATWILDPALRVVQVLQMRDPASHAEEVLHALAAHSRRAPATDAWAPVLNIPNVFEPGFCTALLEHARTAGFSDSGFMRTDPTSGKTVLQVDHAHKQRFDCTVEDEVLRQQARARILRRIVPAIERAFQFKATRMERYLICRYDAATAGHFRPHKDNTTLGTAHRRFAVSIGLGPADYDGGDLVFPEFGTRTYRPEPGGAIVFSCSLLHQVLPVTRGERFAFLPFLYDDAAARIRLANAEHLDDPTLRDAVERSVAV